MDPQLSQSSKQSAWFPMVMTDPALFHTVLCMSATYIDFMLHSKDSFHAQKHMIEAISLINARLQHPDTLRCASDATIAAIAFMAKAEVVTYFDPRKLFVTNSHCIVRPRKLYKLE